MAQNSGRNRPSGGRRTTRQAAYGRTGRRSSPRRTITPRSSSSARRRKKRRKQGTQLLLAYLLRAASILLILLLLWFVVKGIAGIFHPKDAETETVTEETETVTETEPETPEETEPDNRIFSNGRYIDPSRPMVALTYDDGPEPKVGNVIMDSLLEVDGRCTFFMVGNTVARSEESKAEVKRMAEEGFEVANHSYAHKYYNKLSSQEVIDDVLKCNQAIKDVCGVEPTVFRLPGGIMTDAVRNSVKMPIISWSIDTLDWKTREAAATINAVLGEDVHVQDGDIILMHELYVSTGEAARSVIDEDALRQIASDLGIQYINETESLNSSGQLNFALSSKLQSIRMLSTRASFQAGNRTGYNETYHYFSAATALLLIIWIFLTVYRGNVA